MKKLLSLVSIFIGLVLVQDALCPPARHQRGAPIQGHAGFKYRDVEAGQNMVAAATRMSETGPYQVAIGSIAKGIVSGDDFRVDKSFDPNKRPQVVLPTGALGLTKIGEAVGAPLPTKVTVDAELFKEMETATLGVKNLEGQLKEKRKVGTVRNLLESFGLLDRESREQEIEKLQRQLQALRARQNQAAMKLTGGVIMHGLGDPDPDVAAKAEQAQQAAELRAAQEAAAQLEAEFLADEARAIEEAKNRAEAERVKAVELEAQRIAQEAESKKAEEKRARKEAKRAKKLEEQRLQAAAEEIERAKALQQAAAEAEERNRVQAAQAEASKAAWATYFQQQAERQATQRRIAAAAAAEEAEDAKLRAALEEQAKLKAAAELEAKKARAAELARQIAAAEAAARAKAERDAEFEADERALIAAQKAAAEEAEQQRAKAVQFEIEQAKAAQGGLVRGIGLNGEDPNVDLMVGIDTGVARKRGRKMPAKTLTNSSLPADPDEDDA